jgi:hypothetical protein
MIVNIECARFTSDGALTDRPWHGDRSVVTDRDTGATVTLGPAEIREGRLKGASVFATVIDGTPPRANGWWGELPGSGERREAHLEIELDGTLKYVDVPYPLSPPPPTRRRLPAARPAS